ncbi:MAG: hypothetical protein AAF360_10010 [Pseudomonadota bacterium]
MNNAEIAQRTRAKRAHALRKEGKLFSEIAEAMRISHCAARRLIERRDETGAIRSGWGSDRHNPLPHSGIEQRISDKAINALYAAQPIDYSDGDIPLGWR